MKKFINESWLVLVLGAVFACLLAAAQTSLQDTIQANQVRELNLAIGEVVPNTQQSEKIVVEGYARDVYRCLDESGQTAGWAIDAQGVGFADKIRLVVGLSVDGATITGIKVIENIETPGLGNKIADTGEGAWSGQFGGLDAGRDVVRVKQARDRSRNEIQAVTGATISSDAVVDIINGAIAKVRPNLPR